MTTLVVELPTEIDAEEARLLLAIKLYEIGKLSLGQAAQLAGYSKPTFMELLSKYGAPLFTYPPEELRQEVEQRAIALSTSDWVWRRGILGI